MNNPKAAAGLLMFKQVDGILKVFIVHPGGPTWADRDIGAWSIPKGEIEEVDGDPFLAAIREFKEETGFEPNYPYMQLGDITQKSGKMVSAWAFEGDYDPATMKCNEIEVDFPRGSGRMITIPEVDRGDYFTIEDASVKLNPAQVPFLQRLTEILYEKSSK